MAAGQTSNLYQLAVCPKKLLRWLIKGNERGLDGWTNKKPQMPALP